MTSERAIVPLLRACDNACVFCGQPEVVEGRPDDGDAIVARLRDARAQSDEVTFVGGEPTLHPELATFVAEARSLGFVRIGVQTNGRRPNAVAALKDTGLSDVHLSIHGDTSAAHQYHTGIEDSFARAIATLSACRARGLEVVVTTVLTRSNARNLAGIAQLLGARGASAWCISVPRVRGRSAVSFDRVVPRLGLTMPFALHALEVAAGLRLPAFVRGAPSCLLGPFASRALPSPTRTYGEACEGCPAKGDCPGVEPEYLARFGGDELRTIVPTTPSPSPDALRRMFVGEGELAPPRVAAVPEPPAKARLALPMLGKVRPAEREVPRSTERKTGEALREIFTELFDDGSRRRE